MDIKYIISNEENNDAFGRSIDLNSLGNMIIIEPIF